MSGIFGLMQAVIFGGVLITMLLLTLLALPQSKLREVLMPYVSYAFAAFCAIYVCSPIDVVPEALLGPVGIVDDIGAIVAGIKAVKAARQAA